MISSFITHNPRNGDRLKYITPPPIWILMFITGMPHHMSITDIRRSGECWKLNMETNDHLRIIFAGPLLFYEAGADAGFS